MIKNTQANLAKLNQELVAYVWPGYDLHFLHGWFAAYLSAPSDSEDDLLIPSYLILDEDKIKDEQAFAKLVDKLVLVYTDLADSIYENNKLIRPLIDFAKPNSFDPLLFSLEHKRNLLTWLYGYLTGYLAIGGDVTEYATDEALLEDKFYPALFTLCIALFSLAREVKCENQAANVSVDFAELEQDLLAMWESEDGEDITAAIEDAIKELDLADIIGALNDLFYVLRVTDEKRFAEKEPATTLLHKLTTKH